MVASGQGTLFTFWNDDLSECLGAGLVELTRWNDGKLCIAFIRWVAGEDWNQWKHCLPEVEEWAKKAGAQRVVFDTERKAWGRLLPDYEMKSYIFEKELT